VACRGNRHFEDPSGKTPSETNAFSFTHPSELEGDWWPKRNTRILHVKKISPQLLKETNIHGSSEKNSQGEKAVSTEGEGDPCASKERQEKLQSRLRLSLNLPEQ